MKNTHHLIQIPLVLIAFIAFVYNAFGALPPPTGGEFRIGITEPIHELSPATAESPAERQVAGMIAEPLFTTDGNKPYPLLVLKWQMEDENRALRMWLKPDVMFHDGSQLTASDVVASFKHLLSKSTRTTAWWRLIPIKGSRAYRDSKAGEITGIRVISKYEILMTFTQPMPDYTGWLADPALAILPARLAALQGVIDSPIGTGPFFIDRRTASSITLKANRNYHGGRPYLDSIIFTTLQDRKAEEKALAHGFVDGVLYGKSRSEKGIRNISGAAGIMIGFVGYESVFDGKAEAFRSFWRSLIDCEGVVRLFESRRTAPFSSQPAIDIKTVGLTRKDTSDLAGLVAISESIGKSCEQYLPNAEQADKYAKQLKNDTPLVLAVRKGLPTLELVAERIVLAAKSFGVRISVVKVDSKSDLKEYDAMLTMMTAASIEIGKRFRPAGGFVPLYHLLPTISLRKDFRAPLALDVWGRYDFSDVWKVRP